MGYPKPPNFLGLDYLRVFHRTPTFSVTLPSNKKGFASIKNQSRGTSICTGLWRKQTVLSGSGLEKNPFESCRISIKSNGVVQVQGKDNLNPYQRTAALLISIMYCYCMCNNCCPVCKGSTSGCLLKALLLLILIYKALFQKETDQSAVQYYSIKLQNRF